jgi:hypothetical protein
MTTVAIYKLTGISKRRVSPCSLSIWYLLYFTWFFGGGKGIATEEEVNGTVVDWLDGLEVHLYDILLQSMDKCLN